MRWGDENEVKKEYLLIKEIGPEAGRVFFPERGKGSWRKNRL